MQRRTSRPEEDDVETAHEFLAVTVVLLAGLTACGGADPQAEAPSEASADQPRDLSSFDVCARLPLAEVARALEFDPAGTSGDATMTRYASDCTFTLQKGGGFMGYAMVWVYPVEMWETPFGDSVEKLAGLGDEAYATRTGSFDQIYVLIRRDLFLDVRANSPDQAGRLAELAIAQLAGAAG